MRSSSAFGDKNANISVYEQDNGPEIDLKVFQNSKVLQNLGKTFESHHSLIGFNGRSDF